MVSLELMKSKNLQTEILPLEIKILSTKIPIERFYSSLDNEEIIKKLINLSNPIENQETIFIWPGCYTGHG